MKVIVYRIIRVFFYRLSYIFSLPFSLFLCAIYPVYPIKLYGLQSSRIGHYSLNTELMLCMLRNQKKVKKQKIFFFNMAPSCNKQLEKMWKRTIPFFPISILAIQIDIFMYWILGDKYSDDVKKKYEPCSGAVDDTGLLRKNEQPTLFFTKKEKKQAQKILKQLGVVDGGKYVCLIIRDSGYLKTEYPNNDWSYHDHRNASIENYKKAALYLAEHGYYVIRMGKYVEKKFNIAHSRIIDYATLSIRSDFMDVYLCATCFFCISTCTGLDCISQIFRKPVLMTNISPVFSEMLKWYPCTLYIPKLLKNTKT